MKRNPDIHDTDDKDYESFLRGGFRPDPEIVKWIADLKELLMSELGFDADSASDIIREVEIDISLEPEDFLNDMRFCQCSWVGRSGDLLDGYCPKCQEHKL